MEKLERRPLCFIWYPVPLHVGMGADIWLSAWSDLLPMCWKWCLQRKASIMPEEEGSVTLRGWLYTHDPAPAHHPPPSLASVPSAHLEAAEISPPEPGTLFNDMSGQHVTNTVEETQGWNCFKPWTKVVCVFAFIWVFMYMCLCATPSCECTLGCKLQAKEWKSGILKALGK